MPTSPARSAPAVTVRGLGELIAFLPHQFGHDLRGSVVVVGSDERGIRALARSELPPSVQRQRGQARAMAAALVTGKGLSCDVIVFSARPGSAAAALSTAQVFEEVSASSSGAVVGARGPTVRHVAQVRAAPGSPRRAQWRAVLCRCDGQCAQERWLPVPGPEQIGALAGQHRAGGALPTRAELARRLGTADQSLAAAIRVACPDEFDAEEYARSLARVLDVRPHAPAVCTMPAEDLARVLSGWSQPQIRDQVLQSMNPNAGDPLHRRLIDLVACAPDELVAPAASVLGYACWLSGGGALASLAIDRALAVDPTYHLAVLLEQILRFGIPAPPHAAADR